MVLKLTEHVGITTFLLYKQKKKKKKAAKFRYSELLWRNFEFSPIFRKKKSQFSGPACFYDVITTNALADCTHFNLVCINREGPYLPIDAKINFIGGSVRKI